MATEIYILGSGTPIPTPDRFGTAFAVKIDDEDLIMVDCGPAATLKLAQAGFSPSDVSTLFITHHHSDHNVDVPCLLLSRWDESISAEKPITVFGPPPTTDFINRLIGPEGAFRPDYESRIHWKTCQDDYVARGGILPKQPPGATVQTVEIQAGWVGTVGTAAAKVTAAYAAHAQPYLECLAYRIDTPHGSAVFSGDTEYCPSVVELARGADVLFCMALGDGLGSHHHVAGVADARDAGRIAAEAEVKRLVLTHTGVRQSLPENRPAAVNEAAERFDGEIIFGDELQKITL